MTVQTTSGFSDAIANRLAGVASLSLVKGTNLFAENILDDPDELLDQFVILDAGYEKLPSFRHLHLNWDLRFVTSRRGRTDALDALRPIVNELLENSRFVTTSDQKERFKILTVRPVSAPTLSAKLDSGRYLSETTLQFQVIPV